MIKYNIVSSTFECTFIRELLLVHAEYILKSYIETRDKWAYLPSSVSHIASTVVIFKIENCSNSIETLQISKLVAAKRCCLDKQY